MADQKGIKNQKMRSACRVYLEKQAELLPSDKAANVQYVFSEKFNTRMYDTIHSHSHSCLLYTSAGIGIKRNH